MSNAFRAKNRPTSGGEPFAAQLTLAHYKDADIVQMIHAGGWLDPEMTLIVVLSFSRRS